MTRLFGFTGPFSDTTSSESMLNYGQSCSGHAQPSGLRSEQGLPAASWGPQVASLGNLYLAMQGGPFWVCQGRVNGKAPSRPEDLLSAYASLGDQCLLHLKGRFALALHDRSAGRVLLAIDHMGIERLAYAQSGQGIVYSSSAQAVAGSPALRTSLNRQAVFDYLLLHVVPAPDTVYSAVHKLRPGTTAVFENGQVRVRRYWKPEFAQGSETPFQALQDDLRAALTDGITSSNPGPATGAFLSGGLDSSTVVGMLRDVTASRPRTFSISFGVDEYNEIDYARIAARQFDADANEYEVTPHDVVDAFPRIAAAFDEPFGNSSAVPTYVCARFAASRGVLHLLAGDGGDEIFAGNERYAKQRVFEAYRALPAPLRRHVVEPLALRIDSATRLLPLSKLRSYVEQARIPMPERLEFWNFMFRTDLDAMLEPAFRASIDTNAPLRRMAEVYADAPSETLLDRMLYFDWQYTLSDNDLRKVGTACELAGITVSYPMLHPDVVDLANRVPARMKMPGTRLRHFYKQAMRGFLPDEIIRKQKHGFGLPFGVWIKTDPPFADLLYSLLSDLKGRRIIRPGFLDRLIADQRAGHANYFGYAIWDLAMLEAWLQAHPRFTA